MNRPEAVLLALDNHGAALATSDPMDALKAVLAVIVAKRRGWGFLTLGR